MNPKHAESFAEIDLIMKQNKVPESEKGSFLSYFALGMTYATDKMKSYVETNNLIKGAMK